MRKMRVVEENQNQTISDADVERIAASVARSLSGSSDVVVSRIDGLESSLVAAVDSINSNVSSVRSDPSVSQAVTLSDEQWGYVHDSLAFHSAFSFFTLALVAVIVGMRFFSEFSRGFKRA